MASTIDLFNSEGQLVTINNSSSDLAIWAKKGFLPKHKLDIHIGAPVVVPQPEVKLESTITPEKVDVDTLAPANPDRFPEVKKVGKKKNGTKS